MNIEKLTTDQLFALREGISLLIEKGDFLNDQEQLIELEKELTISYQLAQGI